MLVINLMIIAVSYVDYYLLVIFVAVVLSVPLLVISVFLYIFPAFTLLILVGLYIGLHILSLIERNKKEEDKSIPTVLVTCFFGFTFLHMALYWMYMMTPNCLSCRGHLLNLISYLVISIPLGCFAIYHFLITCYLNKKYKNSIASGRSEPSDDDGAPIETNFNL